MNLLKIDTKPYSVLASKDVATFSVSKEELTGLQEALQIVEKFKFQARKALNIKEEPHFEIVYDFWVRKRQGEVVIEVVQGTIG